MKPISFRLFTSSAGLAILLQAVVPVHAQPRLAPLFGSNMVFQQQTHASIWGWGVPGSTVHIRASWSAAATAHVGQDSSWKATVRTPKAGGPYRVEIEEGGSTRVLDNVMVGEVWLCSGQSNMEMPVAGWPPADTILHSAFTISHADLPAVRMYTVRRAFSAVPERVCAGSWEVSSPDHSPNFSATAFAFGRALHKALGVPIGLIHSSWGGTEVRAWISGDSLSRTMMFDSTLAKLGAAAAQQHKLNDWLHQFPVLDVMARKGEDRWKNLSFRDDACSRRSYDDASWKTMTLPTVWEATALGDFDGVVWFRKDVQIPREWVGKELVLNLGPIDDVDITYVNGTLVGSHEGEGQWKVDRTYVVPAAANDSSQVQIAVRVIDYGGGGGMFGAPETMSLRPPAGGMPVTLAGDWRYVPVADYSSGVMYVFGPAGNTFDSRPRLPVDLSAHTPSALYNGMIAPLIPFSLRGAIWYQGEADVGNPAAYHVLFPLMIRNWRTEFACGDFPFYYVQIAPFDYGAGANSAYLREAQTAALAVAHTGMAVTLDIGNPTNIHPANKDDVGGRLARLALAKTYGKQVAWSGPMYSSMKRQGSSIELHFTNAGRGLVLTGSVQGNGFLIAGADHVFRNAVVDVKGTTLVVSHPDISTPEAVRYCFTNTADATLFNSDGLPAPSFRTDRWK